MYVCSAEGSCALTLCGAHLQNHVAEVVRPPDIVDLLQLVPEVSCVKQTFSFSQTSEVMFHEIQMYTHLAPGTSLQDCN